MELKGTVFKEWHAQRQHKVELDSEGTPGGEVAEAAGGGAGEGNMRRGAMHAEATESGAGGDSAQGAANAVDGAWS